MKTLKLLSTTIFFTFLLGPITQAWATSTVVSPPTCSTATAPCAPYGLVALDNNDTEINLTWNRNESTTTSLDETSITLWRSTSGGSYVKLITLPAGSNIYTDTSCYANTKYSYYVTADPNTTPSNVASATTMVSQTATAGTTNLTATPTSFTSTTLALSGSTPDYYGNPIANDFPYGTITSYTWSNQVYGFTNPGTVTFSSPNTLNTNATFPKPGTYQLQLTVVGATTANITVTLNIMPNSVVVSWDDNNTPTAAALAGNNPVPYGRGHGWFLERSTDGVSYSVIAALPSNNSVYINGDTADVNGSPVYNDFPLTYSWSLVSGPGSVTFTNNKNLDTNAVFSSAGNYTLQLTVNGTSTVNITVPENNISAGQTVSLNGDSQTLIPGTTNSYESVYNVFPLTSNWSLVSVSGPEALSSASHIQPTNALDTTATFDLPGIYTIELTVTGLSTKVINVPAITIIRPTFVDTSIKMPVTAPASNSNYVNTSNTSIPSTTYVDTALTPSTTYYYRVRETDWNGNGDYATPVSATTSARPSGLPSEPANLTATPMSATSTILNWTDTNNGSASYVIETSSFSWGAQLWTVVGQTAVGASTYNFTTTPENMYFLRIRASNSSGTSGYTPQIIFRSPSKGTGSPKVYNIGPGQALADLKDLNWATLGPGDVVNIYPNRNSSGAIIPYYEKPMMSTRGTDTLPGGAPGSGYITIQGIPDPTTHQLPIIDGTNATEATPFDINPTSTKSQFYQWSDHYSPIDAGSLFLIGTRSDQGNGGYSPGYFKLENLQIQNGYGGGPDGTASFTGPGNTGTQTYSNGGVSGIYLEKGDHILIHGCVVNGNDEGIFGAGQGEDIRNLDEITLDSNYIFGNGAVVDYGNGPVGAQGVHNSYLEGVNTLYQFNKYGPLKPIAGGSGLKDRGAGTIIRNNFFQGGGHLIDLVEAQNYSSWTFLLPSYHQTYVYGNVFFDSDNVTNGATGLEIHYGGDQGSYISYRKGILHFYNNTMINDSDTNIPVLFDLGTWGYWNNNGESLDARNNIFYQTTLTAGKALPALDLLLPCGNAYFDQNWITTGWATASYNDSPEMGNIAENNFINSTSSPGFANFSDYVANINHPLSDLDLTYASMSQGDALPLSGDESAIYSLPSLFEYNELSPLTSYVNPASSTQLTSAMMDLGGLQYDSGTSTITPPAPTTYNLTVDISGNGTVTPDTDIPYNSGTSVTLTANPSGGYQFSTWSVTPTTNLVNSSSNTATVAMNSSTTVMATFVPITYNINASAGGNGGISPSGTVTVNSGNSQTFTFAPNSGYQIATVTVDNAALTTSPLPSTYTFSNVNATHSISVTFALEPTAPTISTQPINQSVNVGQKATFTVAATGTPTPTYQWQSSTNSGSSWTTISGATSASYTTPATTTLESGTEYEAVITNSAGTATSSPATLTVNAVSSSGPTPNTPTNLVAIGVSDTEVNLTWNRVESTAKSLDETSIIVLRSPTGIAGSYVTLANNIPAGSNIFTDTSCYPQTTYYYEVETVNASGNSTPSASASATTMANQATIPAATVTATAASAFEIDLSWVDSTNGADNWFVERSADGVSYAIIAVVGGSGATGSTLTYADTPLAPLTKYYYRMRTSNNSGAQGAYSSPASAKTLARTAGTPVEPTNFNATVNSAVSTTLNWTDNNNKTSSYLVETAGINGSGTYGTWAQIAQTAVGATSYNLTTTPETFYYVRIRAANSVGDSGYSPVVKVRSASPGTGTAKTYCIAPTQTSTVCSSGFSYTSLGALNWSNLGPGDTVDIYPNKDSNGNIIPYFEKPLISVRGTAAAPITITGIPDPATGQLPIIDGTKAVTNSQWASGDFPQLEQLSLVLIGTRTNQNAYGGWSPGYLTLSNLEIRNGYDCASDTSAACSTTPTFIASDSSKQPYSTTSGIYIQDGDHITIQGCTVHGNDQGIFGAGQGDWRNLEEVTLIGNTLYNNGAIGNYGMHDSYLEGVNTTYEYNDYGPVRVGSDGANIKDRSSGLVIKYNEFSNISGGLLWIMDTANYMSTVLPLASFHSSFVYGNLFFNNPIRPNFYYGGVAPAVPSGSSGEGADSPVNRKGILYFYNNTIVNQDTTSNYPNNTLFVLTDNSESIDARNNIFLSNVPQSSSPTMYLMPWGYNSSIAPYPNDQYEFGNGYFGANWVSSDWQVAGNPNYPAIVPADTNGNVAGTSNFINNAQNNPGFVTPISGLSGAAQDYQLSSTSQAIGQGVPLTANEPPMTEEYVSPGTSLQLTSPMQDLGAFQYSGTVTPPTAVNGTCGSANNSDVTSAPSSNLCSTGTASSVSGSGPFTWTCAGSNNGNSASCSAQLEYKLTVSSSPAGDGNATYSASYYPAGSTVTVTANPSSGFQFSSWSGSSVVTSSNQNQNPLSFTMPASSVNITLNFTALPVVNGVCGSANNSDVTSAPSSNLCSTGTASTVSGSGPFTWTCAGSNNGNTASCSAQLEYKLTVSSSPAGDGNATYSASYYPAGSQVTISANPSSGFQFSSWSGSSVITSSNQNKNPLSFTMPASSVNITLNFTALPVVNGVCGSANNSDVTSAPSSNLCSTGTASTVNGSGPFTWTCAGSNNGNTASCSAQLEYKLTVSSSPAGDGNATYSASYYPAGSTVTVTANPSSGFQFSSWSGSSVVTSSNQNQNPLSFTMPASSVNITLNFTALPVVNGVCGSANGSDVSSAPSSNLCSTGTASSVSGSGPFTWTCAGSNNGNTASCSALLETAGVCGSANGSDVSSAPSSGLCSTGTASTVSGSGPFTWTCAGSNGGTASPTCTALLEVAGTCGSANGTDVTSSPASSALCPANNTASTVTNSNNTYSWSCTGNNGGSKINCSANQEIAGSCGSANNVAVSAAPSSNLCNAGSATLISGSGPWSWVCDGLNNGSNASCSAPIITYNVTATAGSNGSITPSGSVSVNYGANQMFTVTPNTGYIPALKVDGATVTLTSNNTYTLTDVKSTHTLTASFTPISLTISAAAGGNGSISPSGPTAVNYNASQTFTFTPNSNYQIASVVVDGTALSNTPSSYTFSNVTTNHSINVTFSLIPPTSFNITASAGSNGSITPTGTVAVDTSSSQTFSFTPISGYQVDTVVVDGAALSDTPSSYTFSDVKANHTIRVSFKPIVFTITASSDSNVKISPNGNIPVDYGKTIQFYFAPNRGYQLTSVLIDGTPLPTPLTSVVYTFTDVMADHTIAVSSSPITPTVSLVTDMSSYTAPATIYMEAKLSKVYGSISNVSFYNGTTLLGPAQFVMGNTYYFMWKNVGLGTYNLTAQATNASTTVVSAPVTVSVLQLPMVTLSTNHNFYTAPATIKLTSRATEVNGSISEVDFYNGPTLLGPATLTSANTYTYQWTNVPAGTYSLTAVAIDASGNQKTSRTVKVTVQS